MNDQQDNLYAKRHSLAHIMASSIKRKWPEVKFGVGPVVENGFYYDVDVPNHTLGVDDLSDIEAEMKNIIKENQTFEQFNKPIDEAISWAKENNQPYKEELLNDLKREGTTVAKDLDAAELGLSTDTGSKVEEVSFYKNGDFTDLCRGPHVESTSQVGPFKLLRVSGAYWRGNESNPQMQRIYGVAFNTQEELDQHLNALEEARNRDHRKLGKDLDLFVFSDLVGSGLPLWTPRGTYLRGKLDSFVQDLRNEYEFAEVTIPHITKKDLYEKSGHWQKFEDELFKITTREDHEFAMKPMNCPHHAQIYASRLRSYRELPIRYRETTMVYRDEQTGELGGLARVRSITQDDAHVFCRENQIVNEVKNIWQIIRDFYGRFDLPLSLRLSRHDPANMNKYAGSEEMWQKAEKQLREVIDQQLDVKIEEDAIGEAAFYGPKLDFIAKDSLGRLWQVATIQLDFAQPESLDLYYIDESGGKKRPVMIHCAIMGSLERFIAILIEHTAGRFPIWLAPEQVRVATINQEQEILEFSDKIKVRAKELGVRVFVDDNNESIGKKIRSAEMMKVPYTLVIGNKEVRRGVVQPRIRQDLAVVAAHPELGVEEFLKTVVNETKSRASKTSL
ncbi:threonine--tRNA ligase [Candidatus Saccharibacteria bacterium CPR2]|nr:threonine--tRNA ligase [Candidatus Saccharibacteria bacterium CPR2]